MLMASDQQLTSVPALLGSRPHPRDARITQEDAMHPNQFDAFSRKLADGVSRRQAVTRFGAAGLLAGLTSALGRDRTAQAIPAVQADTPSVCLLEVVANIRLGPSAGAILEGNVPGELRGELTIAIGPDGAIDSGRLAVEGGPELPVVGQANGRALNLRVEVAPDQTVVLLGTAARPLDQCTGDVDGLLTGPRVGDLGDWHATATALGGGEGPPPTATSSAVPGTVTPTSTPSAPATATAPAAATATPTATSTATPTETLTPAPTDTPTPAPTETPTPTPEPPTPTPVVCPDGTTDCSGICLDLQNDVNNCGTCGNICPEGQPGFERACAAGNCFFMRERACQEGLSFCNEVCVDRQTNPAHCGLCGNACAAGEICFGGQCARDHRCDAGLTNCNDVCVDLLIDPANCGGCGNVCATGEICFGGQCARDHRND
jgi:hypothetical protein